MTFALLLALAAIAGGTLLTYLYDRDASLFVRLCAGACTGFAALSLIGFVIASFIGLTPIALLLSCLMSLAPLLLLHSKVRRELVRADVRESSRGLKQSLTFGEGTGTLVFYLAAALLCWLVFGQAMYRTGEGIFTGLVNNIGDLPFHIAIISGFSEGANFPPEHPEFAGARLTYPFLADFLTAMFVRAGATLEGAMFWQNFVLGFSFVVLLHRWARELTGDRVAALITPALVLLNGGFGFWQFLRDSAASGRGVFASLNNLTSYYTMFGDTYKWGNAVAMMLVPQRGLLLGFPLAIIVFTLWWQVTGKAKVNRQKAKGEARETGQQKGKKKKKGKREAKVLTQQTESAAAPSASSPSSPSAFYLLPFALPRAFPKFFAAGVVAGLLPLVHAHSFVVLMVTGACLAILTSVRSVWREEDEEGGARGWLLPRWRGWAVFFAAAIVVAVPQMLWATYKSDVQAASFFGWQFGWDRGTQSVIPFWLKNTGVFIPLLVAAILWRGSEPVLPRRLMLFYLPFLICFVVPNLYKLAPWPWDNIKVLFYWWIASAPLVALLLARLWRRGWALRACAIGLLVLLTAAGALDVWRVASGAMEQRIFGREEIALAELVRRETEPRSLILHAPTYNHPVYLTGRRSLMGYAGHLYSHGFNYSEREREVARIYTGSREADALIRKHGVGYIVVGPLERQGDDMKRIGAVVNEAFLQRYKKVGQAGGYSLYKTSP